MFMSGKIWKPHQATDADIILFLVTREPFIRNGTLVGITCVDRGFPELQVLKVIVDLIQIQG